MARYTLSKKADTDIQSIAETSIAQWGFERAEIYVRALHDTLQNLADFPNLGRDATHVRPGYQQMETGSHTVFYQKTQNGVIVMRILHERMNFKQHV